MLHVHLSTEADPVGVEAAVIERFLDSVFAQVARRATQEWSATVRIAGAHEISQLHEKFFGDATDTDVMSFPSGDFPDGDGGYLGDIAISADMAANQADEHGHSTQREILFLAAHGLLHLLGFDDASDVEREEMLELQRDMLVEFEREAGARL